MKIIYSLDSSQQFNLIFFFYLTTKKKERKLWVNYSLCYFMFFIYVQFEVREAIDNSKHYKHSCFNPTLGQIWTNPNVGLKM